MEFDFEILLIPVRQLRCSVPYGVGNFQDGSDMNDQTRKLFNPTYPVVLSLNSPLSKQPRQPSIFSKAEPSQPRAGRSIFPAFADCLSGGALGEAVTRLASECPRPSLFVSFREPMRGARALFSLGN